MSITPKQAFDAIKVLWPDTTSIRKSVHSRHLAYRCVNDDEFVVPATDIDWTGTDGTYEPHNLDARLTAWIGSNKVYDIRVTEKNLTAKTEIKCDVKQELINAIEQCLVFIEHDEAIHGRPFGAGVVARAAIARAKGE